MYICVWYFGIYVYGLGLNGWHASFCITNNHHNATITTHAIKRHVLIGMTTVTPPTTPMFLCFNLDIHLYLYLLVNKTKNPQHLDLWLIDTCDSWGIKRFQTRRSLVWNRFTPIRRRYRSTTQGVVDSYNPIIIIMQTCLKALNAWIACQVCLLHLIIIIKSKIWIISHCNINIRRGIIHPKILSLLIGKIAL